MSDSSSTIVPSNGNLVDTQIQQFEKTLLEHIRILGLPSEAVFVQVAERRDVFQNAPAVISKIPTETLPQSIYLSKFLAATAAGLFDAALNYMWDQTIVELRKRVARYDLSYFFDLCVTDPDRRKKLETEADLEKIEDSELIRGAFSMELISELGYKHLDFIRYMRNRASAAHPNQNEITGLQLIGWLQTCIVQVINLPLSNVVVQIKALLTNIKSNRLTESDARQIGVFFTDLPQEPVNTLCSGFFGIYTNNETNTQTRQNIQLLLPYLWTRVDENTRFQFGVKYAQFVSRNEQQRVLLARQFLESVSALSYVPHGLLSAEIEDAMSDLLAAHHAGNNFYNEPVFAKQLQRITGETGKVPENVTQQYVLGVVEVFLTNGYGVAWNAEPIYLELLQQLDPRQSLIAAVSFRNLTIASKLQFPLCQKKYRELLDMMVVQVTNPAVKELIQDILDALNRKVSPERLYEDKRLAEKIDNLRKILNV
jgi:hypothetical protein